MALGGIKATGLVKFLINYFGGVEDYEVAKKQVLAKAPTPSALEDDTELEIQEEEDEETPTPSSISDNDICELHDAKPFYPCGSKVLSATGVPDACISDNMPQSKSRQSCYLCLYGGCSFSSLQKDITCTHIHCKHLGHAIQCPLCLEEKTHWWSSRSYLSHMTSSTLVSNS